MIGRRPDGEPFEAIEVGIRLVRLVGIALGGLTMVAPGADRPDPTGLGILAALVVAALTADRASRRLGRRADQAERLVAAQMAIDLLVTVGALLVIEPGSGSAVWLVVALPVVEGAIRYGVLGGLSVWLAAAVSVAGWTVATWRPGDGLDTMTGTAGVLTVALAVGLPAGRAADRLTDELRATLLTRSALERQAHLVSVLAVAGHDLTRTRTDAVGRLLVEATTELGFPGAELALVEVATGHHRSLATEPAGFIGAMPTGADLRLVAEAAIGTTGAGPVGTTIGVLANNGEQLTLLVAGTEESEPLAARHEGFALLCHHGAANLAASIRRHRIDAASRSLDHRRSHDPLTSLLNRDGFAAALASAIGRLARGAELRLLLIDLDGFARVNATNGWAAGDQVLVEMASRLRRTSPPGASVGRLEADRFAVFTDERAAGHLADHLRDILARPIATPQGKVVVEASIGQVITADPGYSPTAALREAELRAGVGKALASSEPQPE